MKGACAHHRGRGSARQERTEGSRAWGSARFCRELSEGRRRRRTSAGVMVSVGSGAALVACKCCCWCGCVVATAAEPKIRNIFAPTSLVRLMGDGAAACGPCGWGGVACSTPGAADDLGFMARTTFRMSLFLELTRLEGNLAGGTPVMFRSEPSAILRSEALTACGELVELPCGWEWGEGAAAEGEARRCGGGTRHGSEGDVTARALRRRGLLGAPASCRAPPAAATRRACAPCPQASTAPPSGPRASPAGGRARCRSRPREPRACGAPRGASRSCGGGGSPCSGSGPCAGASGRRCGPRRRSSPAARWSRASKPCGSAPPPARDRRGSCRCGERTTSAPVPAFGRPTFPVAQERSRRAQSQSRRRRRESNSHTVVKRLQPSWRQDAGTAVLTHAVPQLSMQHCQDRVRWPSENITTNII